MTFLAVDALLTNFHLPKSTLCSCSYRLWLVEIEFLRRTARRWPGGVPLFLLRRRHVYWLKAFMMESKSLRFELRKTSSRCNARLGAVHTAHAIIPTPVFMPVGTLGAVKGLDAQDMQSLGARIMLSNAYHLMLRPSSALVAKMGGLHRFMGYNGAILTDSGGFQVYSAWPRCARSPTTAWPFAHTSTAP